MLEGTVQGQGQTRLQATFEVIKKMSARLGSPRFDFEARRNVANTEGSASGSVSGVGKEGDNSASPKMPGYFDVVVDGK